MRNIMDTWELLKQIYVTRLGVDSDIVDYIAVHDIVELCCKGLSISTIVLETDFDEDYIKSVLKEFLDFEGFIQDIDFDCRKLYQRHRYNKYTYIYIGKNTSPVVLDEDLHNAYRINVTLDIMEKEIDKYYGSN